MGIINLSCEFEGVIYNEEWKEINIKEVKGFYNVSNFGRIYSYRYKRLMSPTKDSRGYLQIPLSNDPFKKTIKMHMLVWDHFGEGKRNGRIFNIDHKDEVKTNNHISNLQVLSSRDNTIKSLSKGGKIIGTYYKKDWDRWVSEIIVRGKRIYLGNFNSQQEGYQAYLDARLKYAV